MKTTLEKANTNKCASGTKFYLSNYGTEKNMDVFSTFNEAKEFSSDGLVYTALLNSDNIWHERNVGWLYNDCSTLFLDTPVICTSIN